VNSLPFPSSPTVHRGRNVGQGHSGPEAASKHKEWSLSDQSPSVQEAGLDRLALFSQAGHSGAAGPRFASAFA